MDIKVAQWELLYLHESFVSHITDNVVGDAVVYRVHEPLNSRSCRSDKGDLFQQLCDAFEIYLTLADDKVDNIAYEHGYIQRKSNGQSRHYYRQEHEQTVLADVCHDLFECALVSFFLFSHLYRLLFELRVVDLLIYGAALHKLVVCAYANSSAVVQNDYPVSVLNGRCTLGYDEYGGVIIQLSQ